MSRARTFSRRPGRPAGSGPRPRSVRPNDRKALRKLPYALKAMAGAALEMVPALQRMRDAVAGLSITTEGFSSWQTGRPWFATPEETP